MWLSIHVATYSFPIFCLFGYKFAAINGLAHWIVDFVTSKMTSRLYRAGKNHYFFVVIGADQAIHLSMLVATSYLAIPVWGA